MKRITSRDNPRFKALRRLAESGRERKASGRTLLDGVHLIAACEANFGSVEELIVSETALALREIVTLLAGREPLVLPDALFREMAVVDTPSGIMAVIVPPPAAPPDATVDAVLLDGVQDPGNVGTLMRTAAAAGIRQILLSSDCAGAWSPKVLRAGQGAHFLLQVIEDVELSGFARSFGGLVAVTTLAEATPLYQSDLRPPLAWVFGSEGRGVRPELLAEANLRIRIPMAAGVESLNVAAAAAICLFEALRQRDPA